jgi:hypothetical protein
LEGKMPVIMHLNYIAVIVAAAVYFVIGFFWYMPGTLGKVWAKEANVAMGKSSMPVMPMAGQFIATVIFAAGVGILVSLLGASGAKAGLMTGIKAALIAIVFFIFPANAGTWFFKGKPVLFLIEWGYQSIGAVAAGIILGIW